MVSQSRPYAGIKDIDPTGRTVQFYGSSWNVVDAADDEMVKGCYAKSIQENGPASAKPRIKFLFQHDSDDIIGKFTALTEDATGLLCTAKFIDTEDARDAIAMYEQDLLEHSVGFNTLKYQMNETSGVRLITEVKLWEVSAVTWGCNEFTPLVSLKGLDHAAAALSVSQRIIKLGKALRTGTMQESTYKSLEAEMLGLETAYQELVTLPSGTEPPQGTQQKREPNEAELLALFKSSFTF